MEMKISFNGGKKVYSHYKGFSVETDQPVAEGGDNSAPEPYDLFLASLGTCAGVYVVYFCEKRNITTDGMDISLEFDKNDRTHLIEEIRMKLKLPKDFPEKYRSAVVRSAEMCTVKRNLVDPPRINVVAEYTEK